MALGGKMKKEAALMVPALMLVAVVTIALSVQPAVGNVVFNNECSSTFVVFAKSSGLVYSHFLPQQVGSFPHKTSNADGSINFLVSEYNPGNTTDTTPYLLFDFVAFDNSTVTFFIPDPKSSSKVGFRLTSP